MLQITPHVSWFLWIVGTAFFLGAAAPLVIAPARWGKAFGWKPRSDDPFATYLGRCLGGVAVALSLATFRAAPDPPAHLDTLEILLAAATALLAVHIWGAIRRSQPWQENAEILMYLAIVVPGFWLYSQLPGALL